VRCGDFQEEKFLSETPESLLPCFVALFCFLKTRASSVVLGVWLMRPAEVGLICELECCSNNYAVSCSAGAAAAAAFELYIFIRVCCHAAAVGPNQASLVISKQRSSLGRSLLFLLIKFISRMNQANKYGDAARCPA
jgi:hypothetical protein